MFFVLFQICLATRQFGRVQNLNADTFQSYVLGRAKGEFWMIMFISSTLDQAKNNCFSWFSQAAKMLKGLINFGIIDTSKIYSLSSSYGIYSIPYYRFYCDKGEFDILNAHLPNQLMNAAFNYFPENGVKAKKSWMTGKSAILFTNEVWTPKWWCAIKTLYENEKDVLFGVGKSDKLMDYFNITYLNTILLINKNNNNNGDNSDSSKNMKMITGETNYTIISGLISSFFLFSDDSKKETKKNYDPKTYTRIKTIVEPKLYSPEDFKTICIEGKEMCVIKLLHEDEEGEKELQQFKQFQKVHSKQKIRFFFGKCGKKFPFDFMKKEFGIWFYNPRKEGFLFVGAGEDIETTMDRVLDGSAQFKKQTLFENVK